MEREILDFTQENIRVRAIIEKAKSPSPISKWSGDGSFYNGISLRRIDYAVIKQDDGEYYVFDKPEAGIRKVYRTDGKMNVIAMASVDIMGTLTLLKNQKESTLRAPFMPTLIVKKNKP